MAFVIEYKEIIGISAEIIESAVKHVVAVIRSNKGPALSEVTSECGLPSENAVVECQVTL